MVPLNSIFSSSAARTCVGLCLRQLEESGCGGRQLTRTRQCTVFAEPQASSRFAELGSTPQAIPGMFMVPLRGWFKVAASGSKVLSDDIFIQGDSQPRPIRHFDPSVTHNRSLRIFLN